MCENPVSGVTVSKITCGVTDDASFGWVLVAVREAAWDDLVLL